MHKVIRLHEREPGPAPAGLVSRATALTLPGLPPPRFVAVDVLLGGAGIEVEEVVLRGTPGGEYRMMSIARRNPGLSREAFVDQWTAEAGRLGGETIPDDVRGLAYAQNHPLDDDPQFDAINEVWFDDLDDLRRRAEWFAARPVPDLFAESFSLYLRTQPQPGAATASIRQ